jgi:hypothetical protein
VTRVTQVLLIPEKQAPFSPPDVQPSTSGIDIKRVRSKEFCLFWRFVAFFAFPTPRQWKGFELRSQSAPSADLQCSEDDSSQFPTIFLKTLGSVTGVDQVWDFNPDQDHREIFRPAIHSVDASCWSTTPSGSAKPSEAGVTLHEIGRLENNEWIVALKWETTHGRTQSPIKAQ